MNRASPRLLALLCATIATLFLASVAGAERAVLTASAALPWTDPTHQSPTEVFASGIASQIAGRPARVQCHGATEMAALSGSTTTLGYVRYLYSTYTYRIVQVEDIAHLHEAVCLGLQQYGEAAAKPTRCATTQEIESTVYDTVPVKKKVFYWAKVKQRNGKTKRVRKSKYIWGTKEVPRTVTETVAGLSVPCYGSGQTLPEWYRPFAMSLHVLGHESVHLFDFYVGAPVQTVESAESRAECYGMQMIEPIAVSLGGDADDGRAMARYYWENEYPHSQGTPYWRPDCIPDGPFDLRPNDGVFPRKTGALVDPGPFVWKTVEYEPQQQ